MVPSLVCRLERAGRGGRPSGNPSLNAGDVVVIDPDEEHWHGAAWNYIPPAASLNRS